ncbi:MAG: D-alanine--D-alanine ligase [Parcubacteria group bacterium Greene0714_36]|nr:MAG: D-alanine--D-alanine ligase [Parcubacteria group bacterium Greene0714_36]
MKTVGVFFGSRSPEHDISILTALRVMGAFSSLAGYAPVPVYIDRKGAWFSDALLRDAAFFQNPQYEKELGRFALDAIRFEDGKLVLARRRGTFFSSAKPVIIDIAFPCFHGSYGEDGTIQGLFEMAGVPYVGCGVGSSAIAMNKIQTRRLLAAAGIPGVKTIEVPRDDFFKDHASAVERTAAAFGYPAFVKPNSLGSSIGVARVASAQELVWALEVALQFDTLALVEQAVANVQEVNVAVIGHRELTISLTEEPQFRSAFQTFEEKYLLKGGTIAQSANGESKGKTKSVIPADIPEELRTALTTGAATAFRAIGCSGISRLDFLIDRASGAWYLAEINPLPGTLQAHLWQASGVLVQKLLGFAQERHQEERALMRVFASSILAKK